MSNDIWWYIAFFLAGLISGVCLIYSLIMTIWHDKDFRQFLDDLITRIKKDPGWKFSKIWKWLGSDFGLEIINTGIYLLYFGRKKKLFP